MNADELEVYTFLKTFEGRFVSIVDISRRLGSRGRYQENRIWAKPLLLRMEFDGLVQSNDCGEFRAVNPEEETDFIHALERADPQVPLGDTTIIKLADIDEEDSDPRRSAGSAG
jgi:hypothetical protein